MSLFARLALAALPLLQGAAPAAAPARLPDCDTVHARLELAAEPTPPVREVCISPGVGTMFVFFEGELPPGSVTLEGAERFIEVETGRRLLSLLPSDKVVPGERLKLTVRFAGTAAPATATFLLVVHPAKATRQVEVFRDTRTLASYQRAEQEYEQKLHQCREENEQLRASSGEPRGLTALIRTGLLGKQGVTSRELRYGIKLQPSEALEVQEAWSYRATGVVAVQVRLEFPVGTKPWEAVGAELAGPGRQPLRVLSVWQELLPKKPPRIRVVVEAEATGSELGGDFTLKLWNAAGPGTLTLTGVRFP